MDRGWKRRGIRQLGKMDDEASFTSHCLVFSPKFVLTFVTASPLANVCTAGYVDGIVFNHARAAHGTEGIVHDRIRNVVVQRVLPRTYPVRRNTPLAGGRCPRELVGGML